MAKISSVIIPTLVVGIPMKHKNKIFKKSTGDSNILAQSLIVLIGIAICGVIVASIYQTGHLVQGALNNRIEATKIANTWIK